MLNPVIAALRANNPYEQLISQIIAVESQPLFDIESKLKSQEKFKSVMEDLDSSISALHALTDKMTDTISNPFEARSASLGDITAFSASATDSAAYGTHTLKVDRLASTDTRVTQQYTAAGTSLRSFFDTNGSQTFTINILSPTDADPNNRENISVSVNPVGATDDDILKEISTAINAAMTAAVDAGTINADDAAATSVVNEASTTSRLSLRSGDTGYDARFQFTDSANSLLATLQLNNAAVASGTSGGYVTDIGTSETDSQLNAKLVLDGLTLYRSKNQVTDALSGVTLSLKQTNTTAEEFTIEPDSASIQSEVEDFIEKYNDTIDFIKNQSVIDPDLGFRGSLANDFTFTNLRFQMRNDASKAVPGQPSAGPTYLTDLGIKIEDDGTLTLDDADKLIAAVEKDADAVQSLFNGTDGVATRLKTRLDAFLGADGLIDNRIDTIDEGITRLNNRISRFQERLDQREELLRQQYAQVQETIASFQGQQQFLGGFLGGAF